MRCFIHNVVEAIAVCKECGKAMCANCSAYTRHTGICPECMRDEYKHKLRYINANIKSAKHKRNVWIFLSIFFAITIIVPLIGIYKIIKACLKIKDLQPQANYLQKEINKLTKAFHSTGKAVI